MVVLFPKMYLHLYLVSLPQKNKKEQSIQNKKVGTLLKPNIIEIQFANI